MLQWAVRMGQVYGFALGSTTPVRFLEKRITARFSTSRRCLQPPHSRMPKAWVTLDTDVAQARHTSEFVDLFRFHQALAPSSHACRAFSTRSAWRSVAPSAWRRCQSHDGLRPRSPARAPWLPRTSTTRPPWRVSRWLPGRTPFRRRARGSRTGQSCARTRSWRTSSSKL